MSRNRELEEGISPEVNGDLIEHGQALRGEGGRASLEGDAVASPVQHRL